MADGVLEEKYRCRLGCVIDPSKPCGVHHHLDCWANHHDPEREGFMKGPLHDRSNG